MLWIRRWSRSCGNSCPSSSKTRLNCWPCRRTGGLWGPLIRLNWSHTYSIGLISEEHANRSISDNMMLQAFPNAWPLYFYLATPKFLTVGGVAFRNFPSHRAPGSQGFFCCPMFGRYRAPTGSLSHQYASRVHQHQINVLSPSQWI